MAIKKKYQGQALGRGLDALLQTEEEIHLGGSSNLCEVRMDDIRPNPNQPRRDFDDDSLQELNARLLDKQLRCELTEAAKTEIIDQAFDPAFGARPLRRYVQHTVETMIAKKVLEGSILPGETITVDTANGELILRTKR